MRDKCDNCGATALFSASELDLVLCIEDTSAFVSWCLDGGTVEDPTHYAAIGIGVDEDGNVVAIEPASVGY